MIFFLDNTKSRSVTKSGNPTSELASLENPKYVHASIFKHIRVVDRLVLMTIACLLNVMRIPHTIESKPLSFAFYVSI